jgi:phosphoglycolate phosphatase-like HAD superfamily hydrolase
VLVNTSMQQAASPEHRAKIGAISAAGTLFRARPPVPELLSGLVAEAGHPVGVQRVAAAVSQVESAHGVPDDAPDPESMHAYWTGHVTRILGAARVPADPGTLESVARAAASAITDPAAYELVPGVPSLLDAVEKAGLPMGIVSNFDDLLFGILDGTGLSSALTSRPGTACPSITAKPSSRRPSGCATRWRSR